MKLVYTHENRFFVNNAKNIVDAARIPTVLKNEYTAGAAGDLAPIDTWLELWVLDPRDYDRAAQLIQQGFNSTQQKQWLCPNCHEINDPAFDLCWQCQSVNPRI